MVDLSIQIRSAAWRRVISDPVSLVRKAANAAWDAVDADATGEACVVLAGARLSRRLNRTYRGDDRPTNVLAFPGGTAGAADGVRQWGDVVISLPVLQAECAASGVSGEAHLSHLVVHGLLHLAGHDHVTDDQAAAMERLESQIMTDLGFADPYAEGTSLGAPEAAYG